MKRIIALLLAALLIFAVGCDGNKKLASTSSGTSSPVSSEETVSDTSSTDSSSEDTSSDTDSFVSSDTSTGYVFSSSSQQSTVKPTTSSKENTSSESDKKEDKTDDKKDDKAEESNVDKILDKLQKGINLSTPLEGGSGKDYSSWAYNIKYYEEIKAAGFDHVRITANPSSYLLTGAPDYKIDPEFLRIMDIAVNNAIDVGLIAVLDPMHGWAGKLKATNQQPAIDEFYAVWRQYAERYRAYPETLMFELINEPTAGSGILNTIQMEAIDIIRETNPTRVIALAADDNNGVWNIWNTEFPYGDENCMISIHIYDDMSFTHQGATWTGFSPAQVKLTETTKANVTKSLEKCANYTERTGRKVWVSEWGIYIGSAVDKADAAEYARYFNAECKRLGVANCWWEFCSGFGLYDMNKGEWKDYMYDSFK